MFRGKWWRCRCRGYSFGMPIFAATNGDNASPKSALGPYLFAGAACFAAGAVSILGFSKAFSVFFAGSALRCVTAQAFSIFGGA